MATFSSIKNGEHIQKLGGYFSVGFKLIFLQCEVGLKEPGPKVDSDPGYQFYVLGQAFGLPLIGNEDPFGF